MQQPGEQTRSQFETAAKREDRERETDTRKDAETRTREEQQREKDDHAGDEHVALESAPQSTHRDGQPHGIQRVVNKGCARQDANGRQPRCDREEREQQLDDQEHRQVRRERGGHENEKGHEVNTERERAGCYRQEQRREDAGRERFEQRGARREVRITHTVADGLEHAQYRATRAGT